MIISTQQPYDESRKRDVAKMQSVASDPTKSEAERKKAEEVLYAFKYQRDDPHIQRLREQLKNATLNGDKDKVEKLSEQAKRFDRDYKL